MLTKCCVAIIRKINNCETQRRLRQKIAKAALTCDATLRYPTLPKDTQRYPTLSKDTQRCELLYTYQQLSKTVMCIIQHTLKRLFSTKKANIL